MNPELSEARGLRIRRMKPEEAQAVSNLIVRNLVDVNLKDYDEANILETLSVVTPQSILRRSRKRRTRVLLEDERIIGTVGLTKDRDFPGRGELHSLYIDPDHHGEGKGRTLVEYTEKLAKTSGIEVLRLSASLTAFEFYKKLGYGGHHAVKHGDFGFRIWMKKTLGEKKEV